MIPVLLETPFVDRSVKDIFPPERKVVPLSPKLVPVLAIKALPVEPIYKEEAQEVMITEGDAPHLMRVAGKTNIPPRS